MTESSGAILAGGDRPEGRSAGMAPSKRLHVHVAVENLDTSIRFYSELFAAEPVVLRSDYAKWMLEDPRVNFAISQRGATPGIQHLGIQVESRAELEQVYARLARAERPVLDEGKTTCCYAQSEKSWIEDPQGVRWETFLTTGESPVYGHDPVRARAESTAAEATASQGAGAACCGPTCSTSRGIGTP